MKIKNHLPPRLAEWIIQHLYPDNGANTCIGDFREEYNYYIAEKGIFRSLCWYWLQIFIAIPGFLRNIIYWRTVMLKHYFTIAFRNIMKHKSYSLINLSGLALGMISCIYISLWVQDELDWDGFHKNYHDLYRFTAKMNDGWYTSTPLALVPQIRDKFPEIHKMTRFSPKKYNLSTGNVNSAEKGSIN